MATLESYLEPIKATLFGKQNQRMEYLMDRYFQLSPEIRVWVILGGIGLIVISFFLTLFFYLSGLNSLQNQLDDAYARANRLKDISVSYLVTKQQFTELEKKLAEANRTTAIMGVLEQKTKELGITTAVFPSQVPTTDFPAAHPLAKSYQNAKIEFKVTNLSLKKILDLAIAIESTAQMYRITGMNIRGLYQNKVFFDGSMEVEGIVVKK